MALAKEALVFCSQITRIPAYKCEKALNLLIEQECTLPFVARYRKDATGGLNEIDLDQIHQAYDEYTTREKRRAFILESIEKQNGLTPALKLQIEKASNLQELEDLYGPFKAKTKTKAQKAKERGLEPLAQLILNSPLGQTKLEEEVADQFCGKDKEVKTFREALSGASDIIVEMMAHNLEIKVPLRQHYWENGYLVSKVRTNAESIKDYSKFQDFFDFREPVKSLKMIKAAHRYLALRRGVKNRILKCDLEMDELFASRLFEQQYLSENKKYGLKEHIKLCYLKAYREYLHPSLDNEIKNELKNLADEASIEVFGVNLKNLLLSPYLGQKAVMGVDPAIKTGCKIVLIDKVSKFLGNLVIYPHPPKNDVAGSREIINKIIDLHQIEYIAIGNGTYGRETLAFFQNEIEKVKSGEVKVTMISESGASVYSASEQAQKEFPNLDATVRGGISIARRFQDPLAELVKIDPKAIGVGQYQHDVNQNQLKKSLDRVVENCVNFVGVDLNTASAPLLSYISGIGPAVANSLVEYRERKGSFTGREQLKDVPKFTSKTFEQAAGFLRIYQPQNPLDSTFIHPEHYTTLGKWVRQQNKTIHHLLSDPALIEQLAQDKELKEQIGELTLKDIVHSLKSPKQDPRQEFKTVEFNKDLKTLEDLQVGKRYKGVVSNITLFGAFIDIGLKEKGLVHVSEVGHKFTKNPLDDLVVGQEVDAKVLEVDKERKRISLSLKSDQAPMAVVRPRRDPRPVAAPRENHSPMQNRNTRPSGQSYQKPSHTKPVRPKRVNKELKQNPFSALKDFKLNK